MSDKNKLGLSRRRVLGGLGAIGIASAGAGLGTSAYFSDTESFTNNILSAGELNLIVDYATEVEQGSFNHSIEEGTVDGELEATYSYEVGDVKPGDSGVIVLCPKIVDNPAWLWIGSTEGGTDYENGQTEPEAAADGTGGGTIGTPNDGAGAGELSSSILVDVSFASGYTVEDVDDDGDDDINCNVIREMNNPDDYTLADLASDLEAGFMIDGDPETSAMDPYPASSDDETQNGPCLCIEWELPTTVGNEVQTDAFEMDFSFEAQQQRHNPSPSNPFNTSST